MTNTPSLAALSEMVLLKDRKPTKKHANSMGEVLWYSPTTGFWASAWDTTLASSYSHWMMLPDPPKRTQTRDEYLDQLFESFIQSHAPTAGTEVLSAEALALRNQLRRAFITGANA